MTPSFEAAADYRNIREAFLKALRGKRASPEVISFCRNIDQNLETIQRRLRAEEIEWGAYETFAIRDPKPRTISAAPFADRIIHHALMNVLEDAFERPMIFHSYACRKGKGMHKAVEYAFTQCKTYPWFLKLDVRKYFDSVDHLVLKRLLVPLVQDSRLVNIFYSVIDSYSSSAGGSKGVPIGNLTSQYFANVYLSPLDHYVLERLRPGAYCRYMDDFVLWARDRAALKAALEAVRRYAGEALRLTLKPPVIGKSALGLPFLGFLVKDSGIYLVAKSKRRVIQRMKEVNGALEAGAITEEKAGERARSVFAAIALARTKGFRLSLTRHPSGQRPFPAVDSGSRPE
jgi:retron-type reverse transcriptase